MIIGAVPPLMSLSHQLSSGYGSKTIYVKLQDAAGNVSAPVSASIEYSDTTPPAGTVKINNSSESAPSTTLQTVTLYIAASEDTAKVMVSEAQDFVGASWIPFQKSSEGEFMPGNALANVRVYLNLEDYYPTPGYTYTDSQGKATFYDLNSYNVELPYTFSLASEDGGDGYRPALIQTGPDFWNNETNETQLKVISLKRPGGTDPNAEFQLKDLVWFAQNFQSHGLRLPK